VECRYDNGSVWNAAATAAQFKNPNRIFPLPEQQYFPYFQNAEKIAKIYIG
jgi:hypothetical protein